MRDLERTPRFAASTACDLGEIDHTRSRRVSADGTAHPSRPIPGATTDPQPIEELPRRGAPLAVVRGHGGPDAQDARRARDSLDSTPRISSATSRTASTRPTTWSTPRTKSASARASADSWSPWVGGSARGRLRVAAAHRVTSDRCNHRGRPELEAGPAVTMSSVLRERGCAPDPASSR